jgi:hypothetical protein
VIVVDAQAGSAHRIKPAYVCSEASMRASLQWAQQSTDSTLLSPPPALQISSLLRSAFSASPRRLRSRGLKVEAASRHFLAWASLASCLCVGLVEIQHLVEPLERDTCIMQTERCRCCAGRSSASFHRLPTRRTPVTVWLVRRSSSEQRRLADLAAQSREWSLRLRMRPAQVHTIIHLCSKVQLSHMSHCASS